MTRAVGRPGVAALMRARQVLEAAHLDASVELTPAVNTTNEVWFAGDHVLRIATESRKGRLALEAHVARTLPDAVPHARVIAHGRAAVGEWLVMERLPGRPLSECWPGLDERTRRDAVRQLSSALRALHAVKPSIELLATAHGETPHPLPANRVLELLVDARRHPGVGASVMDAVEDLVVRASASFDPKEVARGIVHGDLHFDNILWDGDRITALLDLEWVRPGPPDLDLDVLLQYCQAPELSTQTTDRFLLSQADLALVPSWLKEDYPELFSHPQLEDRLLLYRLAFDVCALAKDPPPTEGTVHPYHPYNRLRRTVLSS